MMIQPEAGPILATNIGIGGIAAFLHFQLCTIAALFPMQREIQIAGQLEPFAAARVAFLINLGGYHRPQPELAAGIG